MKPFLVIGGIEIGLLSILLFFSRDLFSSLVPLLYAAKVLKWDVRLLDIWQMNGM